MFNKLVKSLRWIILAGMLYTLYVIMFKDDIEFNNQTDEIVLLELAAKSNKSRDKFIIRRRLLELNATNKDYQKDYKISVREQANRLIDAHEKMLLPKPLGNYKYIRNIQFGEDRDNRFTLIINLNDTFNSKLDSNTQQTLKKMFLITNNGMYQYFGFHDGMRLLLVPTFDNLDGIKIMDLNRTSPKPLRPHIPPRL